MAENNPWYLLATLYGVPQSRNGDLQAKNRLTWNRYFVSRLYDETLKTVSVGKRYPEEELTPLSSQELLEIGKDFAKRREISSARDLVLPSNEAAIDFSDIEFDQEVFFDGYIFSFRGGQTPDFKGAIFYQDVWFDDAIFNDTASFEGATFSRKASFARVIFRRAKFGGTTFRKRA